MTTGRSFTIFVILITVCVYSVKTYTTPYHFPDFKDGPNIKFTVSKPTTIKTTTTTRPFTHSKLYDFIFSFSNVGLRKIGPDLIISDKVISLSLDNNEISYISPYAFRSMRNLKHLNLSGNKIPTERILSFINVDGLQTLIIDNNNPMSSTEMDDDTNNSIVKHGVFKKLENLHMCNSQLKDFQIQHLTIPALINLYLCNNSIQSSDIIFNNIPNTLRSIFLDNNLIDKVKTHNLRYLQKLVMDGNIITEVCSEYCEKESSISLKGAHNMQTLSLSNNRISKVSADAFKDTKELLYLDLSGNNITEVSRGTFNNTGRMKYLSLANNKLTTIPTDICSLIYLMRLNLTGNYISAIHANNFCHLAYLESLYLANNSITIIESQAFMKLRALKRLDLSANQLWQLPQQWVHMYLEELHLERNNFKNLDDITLVNMMKLKDVYLDENPMVNLKAMSFRSLSTDLTVHIKNMQIKNIDYKDNNDSNDSDNYSDNSNY